MNMYEINKNKSIITPTKILWENGKPNAQEFMVHLDEDPFKNEIEEFEGERRKIYPNEECPCGSGKKYKKCCGKK